MFIKYIKENQRGVLVRLGRIVKVVQPGLRIIIPFIDRLDVVNLNEKIPNWKMLSAEQFEERLKNILYGKN